jgi:hypothetical protein
MELSKLATSCTQEVTSVTDCCKARGMLEMLCLWEVTSKAG